jgi:uncharacterized protein
MRHPPTVDSFGPGGFRVSGLWRPGSLLVVADEPRSWSPTRLVDLTPDDFAPVIAAGPAASEFVLLGTGAVQALPPPEVRAALRAAGLGLEFMSTANAAQAWGVLTQQGRRLALALLTI